MRLFYLELNESHRSGQKARLREWRVIWEARFTSASPGNQFLFNSKNMPITESITHLGKVMVGCKKEYRKFSYSSWNVFLLIPWYSLCSIISSNSCLGCKIRLCLAERVRFQIAGVLKSHTFHSIKPHYMSGGFFCIYETYGLGERQRGRLEGK